MARELLDNLGPNAACIYRIPGKGNRRTIDTKYEVDIYENDAWATVRSFDNQRDATLFAAGVARATNNPPLTKGLKSHGTEQPKPRRGARA